MRFGSILLEMKDARWKSGNPLCVKISCVDAYIGSSLPLSSSLFLSLKQSFSLSLKQSFLSPYLHPPVLFFLLNTSYPGNVSIFQPWFSYCDQIIIPQEYLYLQLGCGEILHLNTNKVHSFQRKTEIAKCGCENLCDYINKRGKICFFSSQIHIC